METALHVAAKNNAVGSVQALLKHGARMHKDSFGHTPLIQAIQDNVYDVVELLVDSPETTRQERIDGLKFCGAVCISRSNKEVALKRWQQALEEKHLDSVDELSVTTIGPVLLNAAESWTTEDLQSQHSDGVALMIQSLLIFERLLSPHASLICDMYLNICATLAEKGRYSDIFTVCNRGIVSVAVSRVMTFYELAFSTLNEMYANEIEIEFTVIEDLLLQTLQAIEQDHAKSRTQYGYAVYEYGTELIAFGLFASRSYEDQQQLMNLVRRVVNVYPLIHYGSPFIHCIIAKYPEHGGNTAVLHYSDVISLALKCGADVNAVDYQGNTPLHDVAFLRAGVPPKEICSTVEMLLGNGGHIDVQNKAGQTPLDVASSEVKAVLLQHYPLSLQCLAASTILEHAVPHEGVVPSDLEHFITLHLPGQSQ